jgi:hypothetical protein
MSAAGFELEDSWADGHFGAQNQTRYLKAGHDDFPEQPTPEFNQSQTEPQGKYIGIKQSQPV